MDSPKKPGGSSDLYLELYYHLPPGGSYNLSIYIANPDEALLVVWQLLIGSHQGLPSTKSNYQILLRRETKLEERISAQRNLSDLRPNKLMLNHGDDHRQHQNDTVNTQLT